MTSEWVFSGVVLRWHFVATIFRWTASRICEMRWVVRTVGREELWRGGGIIQAYINIRLVVYQITLACKSNIPLEAMHSLLIIMSEIVHVLYCYSFERP